MDLFINILNRVCSEITQYQTRNLLVKEVGLKSQLGEGAGLPYSHLLLNTPPFFAVPAPDFGQPAPAAPSMLTFVYLEVAADGCCHEPGEETPKKRGVSGIR